MKSPSSSPLLLEKDPTSASSSLHLLLMVAREERQRYPAPSAAVAAVHSTAEAFEALKHLRPRVIVIDWDSRDLDGPRLCQSAAAREPAVIIIMTTASVERMPLGLRCGCHAVLLKPAGQAPVSLQW